MEKKEQDMRNELSLQRDKKISEFFACDKLVSPSAVKNSASAMLDVSREESDLFQQDVNAKEQYERAEDSKY